MKSSAQTTIRAARQAATGILCAALVVLLASRMNRPVPLEILAYPMRPSDEVLPEVILDMHSPRSAIASIEKSARSKIQIDENALGVYENNKSADPQHNPAIFLHNVRLGIALSIAMEDFRDASGRWQFREDHQTIIVGAPGKESAPIYCRLYDIHDLISHAQPGATPTLFGGAGGMLRITSWNPVAVDESLKQALQLSRGAWETGTAGWDIEVWSGYLFVTATADGHRALQELLIQMRQAAAQRDYRRLQ